MPFFSFLEDASGVGDVMVHQPERYLPLARFTQLLMRGPSPLSAAERELIAAYVSGLNGCGYCHGSHTAIAADLGVEPDLLRALLDDVEGANVEERMKPVLRYVEKLTQSPSRMTQADADAVFAAGWDEQALADAVAICALFNLYNRVVDGHGITGSPDNFAEVAERVNRQGYEKRTRDALEARGERHDG
ncbi:MAG: carboxymuconolactone decarboxylase family protein [Alphaproteobacteria bacterium]